MSVRRYSARWGDGAAWWDLYIDRYFSDGSGAVTDAGAVAVSTEIGSIEWAAKGMHEPLEPSALDFTLVSMSDRQFVDLYAAAPGDVRIIIRRNGTVFWRGTVDPQFYEEPYQRADLYDVAIGASDLGVLSRIDFNHESTARMSVDAIIKNALQAAYLGTTYSLLTTLTDLVGQPLTLDRISVDPANFYDEDGDPMKWSAVLESVLQPLGLKIRQTPAGFIVYDIAYCYQPTNKIISWYPTSDTLGTGAVYGKITLRMSPYGDCGVMDGGVDHASLKLKNPLPQNGPLILLNEVGGSYHSFDVRWGEAQEGGGEIMLKSSAARYFIINRRFGGQDTAGVAGCIRGNQGAPEQTPMFGWISNPLHRAGGVAAGAFDQIADLFSLKPRHLSVNAQGRHCLRVRLPLLLDVRYNPFEPAALHNDEGNYELQQRMWLNTLVPVKIWVEGDDGEIYHWHNGDCRTYSHINYRDLDPVVPTSTTDPRWIKGAPAWGDCWLSYYNWDLSADKGPLSGGFLNNRQFVYPNYKGRLPQWWNARGDGEFLPMPPRSGVLHFDVGLGVAPCNGAFIYDFKDYSARPEAYSVEGMTKPRWLLYGNPEITITDVYGQEVQLEDEDHEVELDSAAEGDLSIELTCTGATVDAPQARSVLWLDSSPLTALRRSDEPAAPLDKLLLRAIVPQYNRRHTTLTGSVRTGDLAGVCGWRGEDAAKPRFMITSQNVNLADGSTQCKFVELSAPLTESELP